MNLLFLSFKAVAGDKTLMIKRGGKSKKRLTYLFADY